MNKTKFRFLRDSLKVIENQVEKQTKIIKILIKIDLRHNISAIELETKLKATLYY